MRIFWFAFNMVTLILFLYIGLDSFRSFFRYNRFYSDFVFLQQSEQLLKRSNEWYSKRNSYFKNDAFVELMIKQRLQFIRPGEVVVKFIDGNVTIGD